MSENDIIIKSCYLCDYPYEVPADYAENLDEDGVYHSWIKKYNDLWVCTSCTLKQSSFIDFRIQENGECCVCIEDQILLQLPRCSHKVCIQCYKTIYYGSTTIDPPTVSRNDIERPVWPYPFYCSYEEELKGTRKDWMIYDEKEAEYSDFTNKYFNDTELKHKSYDEFVALRDSLILEKVEERLDWMNTEEFINYENDLFWYNIVRKKIEKKWEKFNNKKTMGNGLCPLCRSNP